MHKNFKILTFSMLTFSLQLKTNVPLETAFEF